MKSLIIILTFVLALITKNALACQIKVPTSEVQRYLTALPNGVPPLYSCADKSDEDCFCADTIIWEQAEIIKVDVLDHIKKKQVESCEKLPLPEVIEGEEPQTFNEFADCDTKFEALVCDKGEKIKNYLQLEVYCAVEVMKKVNKLVNSEVKKAQKKAEKEAEKLADEEKKAKRKEAKEAIKAFKFKGTTIKELRDELNLFMKDNAEVVD